MGQGPHKSALDKIKAGRKQLKKLDFPGMEGVQVALRVLTEAELDECRIESWKWVKEKFDLAPDSIRGHEHYNRELWSQMLFRALIVADGAEELPTPLAVDVENLKEKLTPDERKTLIQELADFTAEVNPRLETEEGKRLVAAVVEEAKKKETTRTALELLLEDLPPVTVRRCFISMASQYQALRKARSSHSSSRG